MPLAPILQSHKHARPSFIFLKGMRRHADITIEVPQVIAAYVAIGSRKPMFPTDSGALGRRALRTQKVVVSQTSSADGAIAKRSTQKDLIPPLHSSRDLGDVRACVFVFEL